MNIGARFGTNLRRAREQAKLTQAQLGQRANLHRTEISLLERGQRVPRISTLARLAGALGVRPASLLKGIEWHGPSQG